MADSKPQDQQSVSVSGEEAKKTDPASEKTAQADSGDSNKTENAASSDATSTPQPRPTRHLPTHYKGMPKQWEKNQVPKKDG